MCMRCAPSEPCKRLMLDDQRGLCCDVAVEPRARAGARSKFHLMFVGDCVNQSVKMDFLF